MSSVQDAGRVTHEGLSLEASRELTSRQGAQTPLAERVCDTQHLSTGDEESDVGDVIWTERPPSGTS